MTITYIPENEFGIEANHYIVNEIAELLRKHKNEPETIEFLADMLEE